MTGGRALFLFRMTRFLMSGDAKNDGEIRLGDVAVWREGGYSSS